MEETNMKKPKKEKVSKEECDICFETINKSTRKKITCNMCNRSYCSACFKHYIMNCGVSPVCMWCIKDVSLDFIRSNSTGKFYGEYMNVRTDIFIERAKSQLHLYQEQANLILVERRYKDYQSSVSEQLSDIVDTFMNLKNKYRNFWDALGISSKPTFEYFKRNNYMHPADISSTATHIICNLCHISRYNIYTCSNCNMNKCYKCSMLCFAVDNMRCLECGEQEITAEQIESEFPHNYYIKFIKPRKKTRVEYSDIASELRSLLIEQNIVNQQYREIGYNYYKYQTETSRIRRNFEYPEASTTKAVANFVKKCPKNDCRGFLTSAWKCGICNDYFCADCHKQKAERNDDSHVCDENEKATVMMLKKNTKPCPKCGMPIDRYTGCTQVWTPCCKIGFYWDTMKLVVNERIHSPEYYDYLRRTNNGDIPRERGDVQCGGRIQHHMIRGMGVDKYFRLMEHVVFINEGLPQVVGDIDNTDLSIKYLTGDITEERWKKTLKMRIKKNEKDNHIYNILNMFIIVINDLLFNLSADTNVDNFKNAADRLVSYVNEQLNNIYNRYGCKSKKILILNI